MTFSRNYMEMLFLKTDLSDPRRYVYTKDSHDPSRQQCGDHGTFTDAHQLAQKHKAQHRTPPAPPQAWRGYLHIDIQHQAESDQKNASSQHNQLSNVGRIRKITQDKFGAVNFGTLPFFILLASFCKTVLTQVDSSVFFEHNPLCLQTRPLGRCAPEGIGL